MEKKPMTLTQKRNKFRALQYTTFVGEFVSILTPFIVLGIVNAEDWFYNDGGWKVGLGGTLALALLGIAITLVTKQKTEENKNLKYVFLVVGWFAIAFIFILLEDIMNQIATIMIFGGIGLALACGLDITSKGYKEKVEEINAMIKSGQQEVLKEQAINEAKSSEIKF